MISYIATKPIKRWVERNQKILGLATECKTQIIASISLPLNPEEEVGILIVPGDMTKKTVKNRPPNVGLASQASIAG